MGDAIKHEQEDFKEQTRLENDGLGRLVSPPPGVAAAADTEAVKSADDQARYLRARSEQEKHREPARVYRRALLGVLIGSMESGTGDLDRHDYTHATRAFSCATEAAPGSEWAWRNLALAYGLSGNRKQSLLALQRTSQIAADKAAFITWLQSETAFDRIRSTPEFQTLLK